MTEVWIEGDVYANKRFLSRQTTFIYYRFKILKATDRQHLIFFSLNLLVNNSLSKWYKVEMKAEGFKEVEWSKISKPFKPSYSFSF